MYELERPAVGGRMPLPDSSIPVVDLDGVVCERERVYEGLTEGSAGVGFISENG